MDAGHNDSSAPPAIIILAQPCLIIVKASAIADAPVEQAVDEHPNGPQRKYIFEIRLSIYV